jgi:hypothetical protein
MCIVKVRDGREELFISKPDRNESHGDPFHRLSLIYNLKNYF